ncbi:FAS1 domain-containing protein [Fennellomyces sp. T-0311]|nr:FAS1 domain-containing protein [Fennellomyces sp. T-0311]
MQEKKGSSDKPQLLYDPSAADYRCSEVKQSLFDKMAVDASLKTFMDVLTQVESVMKLVNNSELQQPFTIFAPINSAFSEFDGEMRSHLEQFLFNHVVPSDKLTVQQLQKTQRLDTMLDDESIQVKYHFFSGKTELNEVATVDTSRPIKAINGIAYPIDKLLRPAKP